MRLKNYHIKNFRRLENVSIDLEDTETIFVGANNSGKTSATVAFRYFLKNDVFKIFDFSSPLMQIFDKFGANDYEEDAKKELPNIELDLWFQIDPDIEYGRVAYLLPTISTDVSEIGARISYSVVDAEKLHTEYRSANPKLENNSEEVMLLSEFLAQPEKLKKYFELQYFTLERSDDEIIAKSLKKEDGISAIKSLLRVDFIEAQRNIDDRDTARSNRLSAVFADFYRHHLEQTESDSDSVKVISDTNKKLSEHYEKEFSDIISVIGELGFPSLHDRALKIISELNPQKVLSGDTTLTYVERETEHRLPEAYNGLGFKNLIFIAIQISHFVFQWAKTKTNRPLCHLMFIEEPEVHLHAQVQQAFVSNVRTVILKTMEKFSDVIHEPQLIITTHSSHILAEADFRASRYFKRTASKYINEGEMARICASEVRDLRKFDPGSDENDNLKFLQRYIKLTHCDLFFADAAILVEGVVEKLLIPKFIEKKAQNLKSAYLTTLEVGGAYAHRFSSLLNFIGLPALIITDLDSVTHDTRKTCRADQSNAVTSNATIKALTKKETISDLLALTLNDKECGSTDCPCFIAYQINVDMPSYGNEHVMIPRTFEESFIYENIDAVRSKEIVVFVKLATELNYETDYSTVFEKVNIKEYKKVEFALEQIETDFNWKTPDYIIQGLTWLESKLTESAVILPAESQTHV
ncbi:MAG: AAA family ATPase [Proteobacteria bacterium]|nr:AAA family ATPase [Pseudomonadota bacterium]